MIQPFVEKFDANREVLREKFKVSAPELYSDIVRAVVEILSDAYAYGEPDPMRIHEIDDYSDSEGALLFVIGAKGRIASYWAVFVGYGSCSENDMLKYIQEESDADARADKCLTLALHIVQGLKEI